VTFNDALAGGADTIYVVSVSAIGSSDLQRLYVKS